MTSLASIARFPEIKSAVVGDLNGAVLECVDEPDGESVAAVMGFLVTLVSGMGNKLGLGNTERITIAGTERSCIVSVKGQVTVTTFVGPQEPLAAMVKKLETVLPT